MTSQARIPCQTQRLARVCTALRVLSLIVLVILLFEWLTGWALGQAPRQTNGAQNYGHPTQRPQFHNYTPPGVVFSTNSDAAPTAFPADPSGKIGGLAPQSTLLPAVESVSPTTASQSFQQHRQKNSQRDGDFPGVVRLIAFDSNGQSLGSGSYIGNAGHYGLILSNWHVICDSDGLVHVHFANGFSSYGYVVRADKKWDLALIAISSPPLSVAPMPIAKTIPKPGDPLWIAGYGSGTYRMVGGYCVRYLAPDIPADGTTPQYEIIELSATARQGFIYNAYSYSLIIAWR